MSILYRARQFWRALTAAPRAEDLEHVSRMLSTQQMALFLNQQASEQVHSLDVYIHMYEQGERSPELLSAALLHDVGKSRFGLQMWERVAVVIGQRLAQHQAWRWGQAEPHGWRRPFVVAGQHAVWGAEMAEAAGASPVTVELIRRHHDRVDATFSQPADRLLQKLQNFDHKS